MANASVSLVVRTLLRHPDRTLLLLCNYFLGLLVVGLVASLGHSIFGRSLNIPEANRLIRITVSSPWGETDVPVNRFRRIAEQSATFAAIEGITNERVPLHRGQQVQMVESQFLIAAPTGSLTIPIFRGRALKETDDLPSGDTTLWNCLISYRLWSESRQRGFSLDIGDHISIGRAFANVAGIVSEGFPGFMQGQYADVYLPIKASSAIDGTPGEDVEALPVAVLAALTPGFGVSNAQADIDHMRFPNGSASSSQRLVLRPSRQGITDMIEPYRRPAHVFALVCLAVFLMGVMNVIWLCSSRVLHDAVNLGVKRSLGSTTYRMVAHIAGEHIIVAMAALPVSLLASNVVIAVIVHSLSTVHYPLDISIGYTGSQLGLALIACIVLVGSAAVTALLLMAKIGPTAMTKRFVGGNVATPFRGLTYGMVPAQTAVSILLVVASGLVTYSFYKEVTYPIGFSPDRLFLIEMDTSKLRIPAGEAPIAFSQALNRLQGNPAIVAASMDLYPPLGDAMDSDTVVPMGVADPQNHSNGIRVIRDVVQPGYFNTLHSNFIEGRDFSREEGLGALRSCVLNSAAATAIFGSGPKLGRLISFGGDERSRPCQVVGIVENSIATTLKSVGTPMLYTSMLQEKPPLAGSPFILVRTRNPALMQRAVTGALDEFASGSEIFQPISILQEVRDATRTQRTLAVLLTIIGTLTLMLVALGLYSSLALQAESRRQELGIRIALGASRRSLFAVIARALSFAGAVGVSLGIPLSYVVARLLEHSVGVPIAAWVPALVLAIIVVFCAYALASLPPAMAIWKSVPMRLIVEGRE